VGDLRGQLGAVLAERHPAEDSLIDEPQLIAVVERQPDPQVALGRGIRCRDEELTAHAEMAEHGVASVELHPEVLAATPDTDDRPLLEAVDEVGGARNVPPQRPDVVDGHAGDGVPDNMVGDAATDDLDLGEFGHRQALGVSRPALIWRHAISATICSASFLERPCPPWYVCSPTTTSAVKFLS